MTPEEDFSKNLKRRVKLQLTLAVKKLKFCYYRRASVASETLSGVTTQLRIGDVCLLASETLTGVTQSKIGDVYLFGERAKRARHYQG